MEIETRQAALCIIRHENAFLVAEIIDPWTGAILHRPPGGGVAEGESPEQAVRREVREELGINLTNIQPLGFVDHVWSWNGREVRERAWLFLTDSTEGARLSLGETVELLEANGQRFRTLWRSIRGAHETLPPLCPSALSELLDSMHTPHQAAPSPGPHRGGILPASRPISG